MSQGADKSAPWVTRERRRLSASTPASVIPVGNTHPLWLETQFPQYLLVVSETNRHRSQDRPEQVPLGTPPPIPDEEKGAWTDRMPLPLPGPRDQQGWPWLPWSLCLCQAVAKPCLRTDLLASRRIHKL